MKEIEIILDEIHRSIEGESWQGPSIREILEGVTAADAAAYPVAGVHSIWEVLAHVTAWTRVVETRLRGNVAELAGETNFPPVREVSESAWKAGFDDLRRAESELASTLRKMSDEDLNGPVPNREYKRSHMLYGLAHHNAYHAGQMALLKRALEERQKGAAQR
jgi:uncharacterized damage-inducible protein DinB